MKKYRHVQYEDDGVTQYQCLDCGRTMYISDMDMNFCPSCGVKWEGEHKCRNHNIPRWVYDRWGNEDFPYDLQIWPRCNDGIPWTVESINDEGDITHVEMSGRSGRWARKFVIEHFRDCYAGRSMFSDMTYRIGKMINGKFIGGTPIVIKKYTCDDFKRDHSL